MEQKTHQPALEIPVASRAATVRERLSRALTTHGRSPSERGYDFRRTTLALLLMAVLASVASAQRAKKPDPKFSIVKADILDSQDGYPVDSESVFFPGEKVFLLFNVAGYTRAQYDRVKLSWRIDSFGPQGERFATAEMGRIDLELAPQDEKWMPIIRHSPMIPAHGGAGIYKVVLTVTDELAEKEVTKEVAIYVGGERVEGADSLTERTLAFQRTKEGDRLPDAVYRPGETGWVTCYITGYQLGEDMSFDVTSEVRMVNEDGDVVLSLEPDGAKDATYYPRRWLPATLRLDLDRTIPPGQYTLLVLLHDGLAEKTHQSSYSFTVR